MTARETGQDSGGKTVFFSRSYDEALALVREARSYLAGPGQLAVRKLPPEVGYAYAAESLRLTTRLTESMSWLMFQRALQEGEMTPEEAQREECHLQHFKVCLEDETLCDPALLPDGLVSLLERSERLYRRLVRLDEQSIAAFQ
ncbi:MAG: hypothetical protein CMN55_02910 [Sneathiella sp.]|jgi:regulator of CtrA degradation|uniref:DUF1465 family protein n=1 Tax=Sneathiella sp. TaxID=1964365 RepID=UPI000C659967|nr:DUF1465 family protein [Sneathiella sp.]MAL78056.1 hypothetical protein [Sneathiella sp.]